MFSGSFINDVKQVGGRGSHLFCDVIYEGLSKGVILGLLWGNEGQKISKFAWYHYWMIPKWKSDHHTGSIVGLSHKNLNFSLSRNYCSSLIMIINKKMFFQNSFFSILCSLIVQWKHKWVSTLTKLPLEMGLQHQAMVYHVLNLQI